MQGVWKGRRRTTAMYGGTKSGRAMCYHSLRTLGPKFVVVAAVGCSVVAEVAPGGCHPLA